MSRGVLPLLNFMRWREQAPAAKNSRASNDAREFGFYSLMILFAPTYILV